MGQGKVKLEIKVDVKVVVQAEVEVGMQLLFQVGGWLDEIKLTLNWTQFDLKLWTS